MRQPRPARRLWVHARISLGSPSEARGGKFLTDVAQRLDEFATMNGMPDSAEKIVRTGNPEVEILQGVNDIDVDMTVISSPDRGGSPVD